MILAVDTNVLLDILIPNTQHLEWALHSLTSTGAEDHLILSEIAFAELGSQFLSLLDLERFLDRTGIRVASSNPQVLFHAGAAWKRYAARRKEQIVCPACGRGHEVICNSCGRIIRLRQHILSDFLIGAHAEILADRLITRDRGFYRNYFENLRLITPAPDKPPKPQ
jgi:predicted nucleic acid-binding protein